MSSDGNAGKATIVEWKRGGTQVHGVVFDVAGAERDELDKVEGLGQGYHRVDDLTVRLESGDEVLVSTYIGTRLDRSLKPYDWYHALVIAGAKEHQLPADSIAGDQTTIPLGVVPTLEHPAPSALIAVFNYCLRGTL